MTGVHRYFQLALRRGPRPWDPAPPHSRLVRAPDGACAAFRLDLAGARIARAAYRCTSCATLVALCEHLAELAEGMSVADAARCRPELLLQKHPEIPPERRDRAGLAAGALRAAAREHHPFNQEEGS